MMKKIVKLLMIFVFYFMTFTPYLVYAETIPKKGDLRYQGTTSYIDANSNGVDIGLVTKKDQYTSTNGQSVEVSAGLFNKAENNNVTTISELSENDVEVRKIVTKINDDGKYKIDFQVRGKGTKLQVKAPVYVVVVFDNSNSMAPEQNKKGTCSNWKSAEVLDQGKGRCYDKWDKAINGAKDFAKIIHNNIPSANIALVSFAGKKDNTNYNDAKLIRGFSNSDFSGLNESRSFKIEMPVYEQGLYSGGTNLEAGLRSARQLLSNKNGVPSNALKYVVVMSDGEPSFYYNEKGTTKGDGSDYDSTAHAHAVKEAKAIKTDINGKIYSIGYEVPSNGNAEIVLNDISSNIKNNNGTYTGNYYASGNVGTIASKFTDIATEIIKDAGINAYITDNIGDAFTGSGTGVTADGKTYESQILPSIYEKWSSLGSFTIQIDPDSPTGWYQTNKGFTLTYYDVVNERQRVIECNDNPEVYWIQNTYDYEVRFYYEDGYGNYVEDELLRKDNLKAAHNERVYELTSEIMDSKHLKEGYTFVEVKNGEYELINELNNQYSIVVDKNSDINIIRVYYKKVFTLSVTKLVEDYDKKNPDMNKDFQFKIKLTDNNNNPITGTYLYKLNNQNDMKEIIINQSGIGMFRLKHNDTITFVNLPRNLKYKVTELYTEGYIVEITYPNGSSNINTTTGILNLNSNQKISFLNIVEYVLPETGSKQNIVISIISIFLIGMPTIYLVYSFIKKDI